MLCLGLITPGVSGGVIATWTFSENNEEGWERENRLLFGVIGCFRETEPIDKFLEIYKQERNVRKRERTRGRDFRKLANRIAGPADQKSDLVQAVPQAGNSGKSRCCDLLESKSHRVAGWKLKQLCYNFEANLHLWATSVFPLKAFTELVEAHSPDRGLTCFTQSLLI